MINKNKLFRQVHIYLSLFFLPAALLFAITGVAYIFGINQDFAMKKESFLMPQISAQNEGELQKNILNFLAQNKIKIPSNTELKEARKSGGYEMGGIHYSIKIAPNSDGYEITAQTRSLLGDAIMLHKDKARWYFSVLSVGFGACLILLYLSGLMITLVAIKKERKPQILTLIAGVLVTIILAYLSV